MPDVTTQSESLEIKGTCTSSADGKSTWTFTVEAVTVETTVDSGGKLKFDSRKDKEVPEGWLRYAAIKGVTFTATFDSEGAIQSCSIEDWPKTCDMKVGKYTRIKNSAASEFHDPTGPRAWLELIFHTGPGKGKEWKRTLHIGNAEEVDMKLDGQEQVSGEGCVKVKVDTADQPKDAPNRIPREMFKSGKVAFWRAGGCALKVDIKGGIQKSKCSFGVDAQARWEVNCVKKGVDPAAAKGK